MNGEFLITTLQLVLLEFQKTMYFFMMRYCSYYYVPSLFNAKLLLPITFFRCTQNNFLFTNKHKLDEINKQQSCT
jgi:hypothetical protein